MNKKTKILVVVCFYSFGFANAQDQEIELIKPKPKQELSLNVMSVLTKKQTRFLTDFYFRPHHHESWQVKPYINIGLQYKRVGKKLQKRMGFTYHINKVQQDHISGGIRDYYYQSEGHAIGLELRYVWQKKSKLNKKFQSTWGVDVFSGYYSQQLDVQTSSQSTLHIGPLCAQLITVGVSPNIGIKYFVTPAISIGIETHVSLLYFKNLKDNSDKGFYGTNMNYSFPLTNNFNTVSFVEPARFIQIGYHF